MGSAYLDPEVRSCSDAAADDDGDNDCITVFISMSPANLDAEVRGCQIRQTMMMMMIFPLCLAAWALPA
jgi:hypothetical protein